MRDIPAELEQARRHERLRREQERIRQAEADEHIRMIERLSVSPLPNPRRAEIARPVYLLQLLKLLAVAGQYGHKLADHLVETYEGQDGRWYAKVNIGGAYLVEGPFPDWGSAGDAGWGLLEEMTGYCPWGRDEFGNLPLTEDQATE